MSWKISLPMYNVSPRLQQAYEALLSAVMMEVGLADDVEVVRAPDLPEFWHRPDMLLGQTCGYPYRTALRHEVDLLAVPCFDFPGCAGLDYSSVIVVRDGAGIDTLADARGGIAAVNDPYSNSGMNVLRHAVAPLAWEGRFFGALKWSGSHAASVRMVRDGGADIAAIDCVTYGYLKTEHPASVEGIAVLRYSVSSPGLPLVASIAVPPELRARLRAVLLDPGARLLERMREVHIRSFAAVTDAAYDRIMIIEAEAQAAGYPSLS